MPKKRRANGRNKPAGARGHVRAPSPRVSLRQQSRARPNPNLLEVVREHLDDDLDTPGAIAAIDAAAAADEGVLESAALLGVDLV